MSQHNRPMDKISEATPTVALSSLPTQLIEDVRALILQARERLAVAINAEMTLLYWHIGVRIRKDVLLLERAEYGKQILATVSQELTREFGKGFAVSALSRMIIFAECFPAEPEVLSLAQHPYH